MTERHFGKVVDTIDKFTIVMDKGSEHGVKTGDRFLVVGLGKPIYDPDTQAELGCLEITRGKVSVSHVQEKISTACSCEVEKPSDVNVTPRNVERLASLLRPQHIVTEPIAPGEEKLKELDHAQIGDLLLKL